MAPHYNAFISYRHCPQDSRIAQKIHRGLERFHVPGKLRKVLGGKRIERIFRDKEELPLSSNLSDDILLALEKSDYLIVICSPRTKESKWVQREIDAFLCHHDLDRILIVLAEGEPEDVVPPILLEGREPLCCDYRLPNRKAVLMELPRLAAALLDCAYDDLVQRKQQYRRRILTAALSSVLVLSLGFGAYYFWTSMQIQKNYQQSLKNQSRFLATESQRLLGEGDRLSAIALALEALPSDENDRPWVAEAELALSKAVGAYISSNQVQSRAVYTHNDVVLGFDVSASKEYLISWDDSDYIYVWDIKSKNLLHAFNTWESLSVSSVTCVGDSSVLIANVSEMRCYDYLTGELLWKRTADEPVTENVYVYPSGKFIAMADMGSIYLLDARTGELLANGYVDLYLFDPMHSTNRDKESMVADRICVNENEDRISFRFLDSDGYRVLMLDLSNGDFAISDVQMYYLETMCYTTDDRLILAGRLTDHVSSTFHDDSSMTLVEDWSDVVCVDPSNGEMLWQVKIPHSFPSLEIFLDEVTYRDGEGQLCHVLYCSSGDGCVVVDLKSGTILRNLSLPDSVVCTNSGDGFFQWLLHNGQGVSHSFGEKSIFSRRHFADNISRALISDNIYVLQEGSVQIISYAAESDPEWTEMTEGTPIPYPYVVAAGDRYLLVSDFDRDQLWCYDLQNKSQLWQLNTEIVYTYTGMDSTGSWLYGYTQDAEDFSDIDSYTYELVAIELATGRMTRHTLEDSVLLDGETALMQLPPQVFQDRAVFSFATDSVDGEVWHLCTFDPETGASERYTMEPNLWPQFVFEDDNHPQMIVAYRQTVEAYDALDSVLCLTCYDLQTGKTVKLAGEWDSSNADGDYAWSDDGSMIAMACLDYVVAWDQEGQLVYQIPTQGKIARDVCFLPGSNDLAVLYQNGELICYGPDGAQKHRTELDDSNFRYYFDVNWCFSDDVLGIGVGPCCALVDMVSWKAYTYVSSFLHFDGDSFYVYTRNDIETAYICAYYPRYTLEELTQKGQQILGNYTLSPQMQEMYGIE